VVADDGTMYISDFQERKIIVVREGEPTRAISGFGGAGGQRPRLATYGKLLLVTDPTNERIVAYDRNGKQRGVYVFPASFTGTRPIGIAVSPDGLVYVADASGYLRRLRINIPPAVAAELDAIP
jgi:hypothetical protein